MTNDERDQITSELNDVLRQLREVDAELERIQAEHRENCRIVREMKG